MTKNDKLKIAFAKYWEPAPRYSFDVSRIQDVAGKSDIFMTAREAYEIWSCWSATLCAGWLTVIDDDEIIRAIDYFIEKNY